MNDLSLESKSSSNHHDHRSTNNGTKLFIAFGIDNDVHHPELILQRQETEAFGGRWPLADNDDTGHPNEFMSTKTVQIAA